MKKFCFIIIGIDICCLLLVFACKVAKNNQIFNKTTETLQKSAEVTDDTMTDKPRIAITFDDGPNEKYTPMLLDGLKARNVRATFFIIGEKIQGNEELLKRMQQEGHIIGNHTYSHVQLTKLSEKAACDEIRKTCEKIYEVTGKYCDYIRPPFGCWNPDIECQVNMFPVSWTIDPLDWKTKNTAVVIQRVVKRAENNGIILLHDDYESSIQAAFAIIDILQSQGYEFVTVEDLML